MVIGFLKLKKIKGRGKDFLINTKEQPGNAVAPTQIKKVLI